MIKQKYQNIFSKTGTETVKTTEFKIETETETEEKKRKNLKRGKK